MIWGTVEIAVTIIACSIPILRALLSDYKRSRYAGTSARTGAGGASSHFTTKRSVRSAVTSHGRKTSRRDSSNDEDSDTSILPVGDKGIVRTAEVTIEYSSREDEDGLEMTSFDKPYSPRRI